MEMLIITLVTVEVTMNITTLKLCMKMKVTFDMTDDSDASCNLFAVFCKNITMLFQEKY